jgi:hypothetical protein
LSTFGSLGTPRHGHHLISPRNLLARGEGV